MMKIIKTHKLERGKKSKLLYKIEILLSIVSLILISLRAYQTIHIDWLIVLIPVITLGALRNSIIISILLLNVIDLIISKRK